MTPRQAVAILALDVAVLAASVALIRLGYRLSRNREAV